MPSRRKSAPRFAVGDHVNFEGRAGTVRRPADSDGAGGWLYEVEVAGQRVPCAERALVAA